MQRPITYLEPNRVARRLRQHDLAGLRCHKHGQPPEVNSSAAGLQITVCCGVLDEAVRRLLGL